MNFEFRMKS